MTGMDEYIGKSVLYEKIAQLEELARNRYLVTSSNSPCYSRYMAQLDERTYFKHIIADFPAADVEPVKHGRWKMIGAEKRGGGAVWKCDGRDGCGKCYPYKCDFCPNCGAKMVEEAQQ